MIKNMMMKYEVLKYRCNRNPKGLITMSHHIIRVANNDSKRHQKVNMEENVHHSFSN